jgi:hypothetical protein
MAGTLPPAPARDIGEIPGPSRYLPRVPSPLRLLIVLVLDTVRPLPR